MFAVRGGMLVGVPVPSMFYREKYGHWYTSDVTTNDVTRNKIKFPVNGPGFDPRTNGKDAIDFAG